MKEQLLKPTGLVNGNLDHFLQKMGIKISESPDGHQMTTIRFGKEITIYGFKTAEDCKTMANFLIDNDIRFEHREKATGARYEYHLILR